LLLAFTITVTSVVSRIYQFWDVGSNSWFDRLKGDGWEFQRGAATVEQDQFGDRFTAVKYLKQGWTPADSMWFYNTTQGSDVMPYDFYVVLKNRGTSEPFCPNENMNYSRSLPQKATLSDPD